MKFPIDITLLIRNNKKVAIGESTKLIVFGYLVFLYVLNAVTKRVLGGILELPDIVVSLVFWAVVVVTGGFIYWVFIFKASDKREEYTKYENDSFEKYIYVRKDSQETIEVKDKKVHVYEYKSGSAFTVMCFKFGENNETRAKNTKEFTKSIIGIANRRNLVSSLTVMTENFETSKEFNRHVKSINSIKDQKVSLTAKRVSEATLEKSRKESNVDVIYFTLKTVGFLQRNLLEGVITEILSKYEETQTSFRSVEFLDLEELIKFYSEFYGVESIDFSSLELMEITSSLSTKYNSIVSMYSLEGTDDSIYLNKNNKDVSQLVTEQERRLTK